jgi:hypothetical protein
MVDIGVPPYNATIISEVGDNDFVTRVRGDGAFTPSWISIRAGGGGFTVVG